MGSDPARAPGDAKFLLELYLCSGTLPRSKPHAANDPSGDVRAGGTPVHLSSRTLAELARAFPFSHSPCSTSYPLQLQVGHPGCCSSPRQLHRMSLHLVCRTTFGSTAPAQLASVPRLLDTHHRACCIAPIALAARGQLSCLDAHDGSSPVDHAGTPLDLRRLERVRGLQPAGSKPLLACTNQLLVGHQTPGQLQLMPGGLQRAHGCMSAAPLPLSDRPIMLAPSVTPARLSPASAELVLPNLTGSLLRGGAPDQLAR